MLVGCSGQTAAPASSPTSTFRISISAAKALTLDDIAKLKVRLGDTSGQPPAQQLSATAFDDYSSLPIRTDSEWLHFVDLFGSVRQAALDNGWDVLIEGYVESTDPVGTPYPLSQRRADETKAELLHLGYPASRVRAVGRGVGGPTPSDRRVVISFVRSST